MDVLPRPDDSRFKVFESHQVADLRRWKPRPPNDPSVECLVVCSTLRKMMKTAPADELRVETSTTGRDVFNRVIGPDVKVHEVATDRPVRTKQLVLDMTHTRENEPFELEYTSTFLDALQTPDEQWLGAPGYDGADRTTLLILFPGGRPFRDYRLRFTPTQPDPRAAVRAATVHRSAHHLRGRGQELAVLGSPQPEGEHRLPHRLDVVSGNAPAVIRAEGRQKPPWFLPPLGDSDPCEWLFGRIGGRERLVARGIGRQDLRQLRHFEHRADRVVRAHTATRPSGFTWF